MNNYVPAEAENEVVPLVERVQALHAANRDNGDVRHHCRKALEHLAAYERAIARAYQRAA